MRLCHRVGYGRTLEQVHMAAIGSTHRLLFSHTNYNGKETKCTMLQFCLASMLVPAPTRCPSNAIPESTHEENRLVRYLFGLLLSILLRLSSNLLGALGL